jgi:xylan 1,4-beta-xylosidase
VHRAPAAADGTAVGVLEPVDHQGGDVLAVPDPWYVDTTGGVGQSYAYAVASVPEVTVTGALGDQVVANALPQATEPPVVELRVDTVGDGVPLHRPWQPMIGSERLSQLLCTDLSGGQEIGTGLLRALTRVRDEIGVDTVRAHAILHDDLAIYQEVDGQPVHDFSRIDTVYDILLQTGLRPCVEIGFMPRDLASDPDKTVFAYRGFISPPKDWDRWYDLVRALVAHFLDRYGDEVLGWDFEVWNEANLEVFWRGTRDEWMHLHDATPQRADAASGCPGRRRPTARIDHRARRSLGGRDHPAPISGCGPGRARDGLRGEHGPRHGRSPGAASGRHAGPGPW